MSNITKTLMLQKYDFFLTYQIFFVFLCTIVALQAYFHDKFVNNDTFFIAVCF